jgi:MFS family permease
MATISEEREAPYPDQDTLETPRRDWTIFIAINFLFAFGFAIYSGVFQNFLRDAYGPDPLQLGNLESLREIPGLLAALTAGTLVALAESRVAGLGLILTGVGIGLTGNVSGYVSLVLITVFWSVGFHLWAAVSPAITLTLAKGKEGGRHLGQISAVGATATLVALGLSTLVSRFAPNLDYRLYFYAAGICISIGGLYCLLLSHHAASATRARLVLRREYGLFYLLTFLDGCRRQIFGIFASFTLIAVYKAPLGAMLFIQFVSAILAAATAPAIGRLVDRIGERRPLIFYSAALVVLFIGYATFQNREILFVLFLIDRVLFSFSVGYTTYLHRIVRPNELTPCVSMGVTMNHIAAVTVPVGGAWLWKLTSNYQLPFWIGVGVAFISLLANYKLPHSK